MVKSPVLSFLIGLFGLMLPNMCCGQVISADTIPSIKPWTAIGLMTAGIATSGSTFKRNLQTDVQDIIGTTESDLDDYLAFVPSGQVLLYALNKNNTDRGYHIKAYAYSTAINLGATWALKSILNVERPRGGRFAFPSGHTSFAFSTATASYMALKDKQPILAWASFAPAAVVGVMRVQKNRHWVPDVLFGAGLGIISTQLTYRYLVRPSVHKETSGFLSNLHFDIGPGQISLVYHL